MFSVIAHFKRVTNGVDISLILVLLLNHEIVLVLAKLAALIPDPNLPGTKNNYFAAGPFAFNRNQIDSKFNYNVSHKLTLSGTFGVWNLCRLRIVRQRPVQCMSDLFVFSKLHQGEQDGGRSLHSRGLRWVKTR